MEEPLILPLINSKNYRNLKPFLVAVFFISSFSFGFVFLPTNLLIALGIPSLLVVPLMYRLSKEIKPRGHLYIDYREIKIIPVQGQVLKFPIEELKDLRILRGATHHKTEDEMYPPDSHDNWISFTHGTKKYKYEFGITSIEENEKFEEIVKLLRETHAGIYYASI